MKTEYPIPLLTVTELSEWLRIKSSTIRKKVCYGHIPHIKVGRRVLFRRTDIEAWLESINQENKNWTI
jgi:excisionase family DNA binding protein